MPNPAVFRIFGEDATGAAFRSVLGGSEKSAKAMERIFRGAFGNIGGAAGAVGKHLGAIRMLLGVGGIAGAVGLATAGFAALYSKVKESREEHERISDLADRLALPSSKVREYSEEWANVLINLRDVSNGFAELRKEQDLAFRAFGLDPGIAESADKAITRIAAASGSKSEKVDVIRILTGMGIEQAEKKLEDELKRLNDVVGNNRRGGLTRQFQREGVQFGTEDIGDLRRGILAPVELKQMEELEEGFREIEEASLKLRQTARKNSLDAILALEKDAAERRQEIYAEERAEYLKIQEGIQDDVEDALKDGDRATDQMFENAMAGITAYGEAWAEHNEEMARIAAEQDEAIKGIFDEGLFRAWEDGLDGMLKYWADTLAQMAIQAAATEFFNMGGGGVGKFFSSLFGGKLLGFANGGRPPVGRPSLVGERGPELFVPDSAGSVVPNHRLGGSQVVQHISIDARGSSVESVKLMQQTVPAIIRQAVTQARLAFMDDLSRGVRA